MTSSSLEPGRVPEAILGIFSEKLSITVASPTVDLLETGLVDSVTLVELLLELEQRFGVTLPLEALEIEDFRTITRIANLVTRTRSAPEPELGVASAQHGTRPVGSA